MCRDQSSLRATWRAIARVALALAGFAGIVGSGGGLDVALDFSHIPPAVNIDPPRAIVQVGAPVTFEAVVISFAGPASATVQWCRRAPGASDCVDIAGATGRRYTLAAANLADDGARFEARVTDLYGSAQSASWLLVSSAPPVVLADGEFAASNWAAAAVTIPASGGPTYSVARVASGGNPDAWRAVTYSIPASGGAIRVYHTWLGDAYDPATQGAVHAIDFAVDCVRTLYDAGADVPTVRPVIEQGGRRFVPTATGINAAGYCVGTWQPAPSVLGFAASEFSLVDGPACGAGESCPDFSAQAAPIRFGIESAIEMGPAPGPSTVVQGVDNWRVAVWRR